MPAFFAAAAILLPRLYRDELAHPLDRPSEKQVASGPPRTPKS
ncbi:MAG: hypothetical protein AVDCRST_MAG01-01-5160 [uncultured Rubrobacteraceae bacterium]|uniref:Uncharacterized protein n=1 Tax=uncultured Rubrobacteraceae bacterium TaxID=349277 RepID=A0A6J4QY77_9ACTN|nr:MAG: hypothetical protein AVDCRST_MAG01-01-5160 [uncultured Rubrobacteraceae bacterium]